MPLHDAVGINCKKGATTENQGSAVKYMGFLFSSIWDFFAGFLFYSPIGSVTGCDSSLGSFCYSPVFLISRSCIFFPAAIITTME